MFGFLLLFISIFICKAICDSCRKSHAKVLEKEGQWLRTDRNESKDDDIEAVNECAKR